MRVQRQSRLGFLSRVPDRARGPLLALGIGVAALPLSALPAGAYASGALLLPAVIYATLRGGAAHGLGGAAAALGIFAVLRRAAGQPLVHAGDDAYRLLFVGLGLVASVLLAARHKARLDRATARERDARADAEASRRELAGVLECITDGFLAFDREWRVTYVNARGAEFLRRPRAELLGRVFWEALPELVGSRFYTEYYRAVADRVPVHFEAESRVNPGQVLEVHAYPSERGLSVYFQNITARKRAIEALHSGEARFRALIDHAADIVAIIDLDRCIRFVGPTVERILGYPPEDVVGRRPVDFVHPDDLAIADAVFERVVRNARDPGSAEVRFRHRDGSWRTIEYSMRNLLHEPAIRGLVINARDITARKEAERAVRASEERYRSLVNGIPVGLYRTSPDGTILDANDTLVELLRYPDREMLLHTNAIELYADPRDRCRFQELMRRDGMVRDFEVELVRLDGSTVPVRITSRAVMDAEGNVLHFEGALEDITARLEAEEAARKTLELFRFLQRATNDPVYDWDIVAGTLHWNEATYAVFDYAPDDVRPDLGWWTERLHPEDRDRVTAGLQAAIERGDDVWVDEYRFRRGDGSYACIIDRGHIVRTEAGEPIRMIGSMVDMTERRRAEEERRRLEEQLRQAQKMEAVGRLAGGIAHDFNNLLTAIQGHAEVLLESAEPDAASRAGLDQIRRAAERASLLTQQLLAFSRRQVLQPRIIDLNRAVREIEAMLVRVIGEDIELVTRLDDDIGPVRADPGQMEQVIMNLVVNARDAMPTGGRISIETTNATLSAEDVQRHDYAVQPGDYVVLSVTDTGEGMSEEVRARIFEPFFTTKELGKGTGLGLSTVYGIVKQSGGHIWVQSELGAGTRFRIFLPRAERSADDGIAADDDAEPSDALPPGTETVLLVEDEEAVRSLVRKILEQQGYRVLEARSGNDALALSASHPGPIDLLLTDVVMPEMSGRELAERLLPDRPSTSVLFISGYTEDAVVRHGIQNTRINFLEKPFSPAALARKVREVLESG
ncbi:MAG TPA: PAS domain S-box protein [Longimicrobiales bacterium]